MIKTKPTYYCPNGSKIEDIIEVIYIDGTNKIGHLKVVTDKGEYRWDKPEDLEPQDEVEKAIGGLMSNGSN